MLAPTNLRRASRRFPLPTIRATAKEIYGGYEDIMRTRNLRGDRPVGDQLQEKFGIPAWEWTRLKIVYEASLTGDDFAAELVTRIDDENDKLTPSGAYRLLNEHKEDDEIVANLSSFRLDDLAQEVIRAETYFKMMNAALRRGVRINRGGRSDEECAELAAKVRAVSLLAKNASDLLSTQITKGNNVNGRKK